MKRSNLTTWTAVFESTLQFAANRGLTNEYVLELLYHYHHLTPVVAAELLELYGDEITAPIQQLLEQCIHSYC